MLLICTCHSRQPKPVPLNTCLKFPKPHKLDIQFNSFWANSFCKYTSYNLIVVWMSNASAFLVCFHCWQCCAKARSQLAWSIILPGVTVSPSADREHAVCGWQSYMELRNSHSFCSILKILNFKNNLFFWLKKLK